MPKLTHVEKFTYKGWTCPKCGKSFKQGGFHSAVCGTDLFERRFWARVNKDGPNGCWLWTGYCQRFGHGWTGSKHGLAHRYAYEQIVGPIPDGKCLLHHCDTPACVNPEHLFLGDRQANSDDKIRKGRYGKSAKLNEAQVREIRAVTSPYREIGKRLPDGLTAELCGKYGVRPGTLYHVVSGKHWRHVK